MNKLICWQRCICCYAISFKPGFGDKYRFSDWRSSCIKSKFFCKDLILIWIRKVTYYLRLEVWGQVGH